MDNSNPFRSQQAIENSCYCRYDGNELTVLLNENITARNIAKSFHDEFLSFINNGKFSCIGGKSAINQRSYGFGVYKLLGSEEASAGLARDLFTFVKDRPSMKSNFTTFIACFPGTVVCDEYDFEKLLWIQLQALHDLDKQYHIWDVSVSSDPENPRFSFSFAERAFFIVGLHQKSSRLTRQFAWPTIVFNAHDQFEHLRSVGKYENFKRVIRNRDVKLQGSINPNLADFTEMSEARQYSGRFAEKEWKCPFHT